ncbi:MAG: 50S ribosomal protein L10 [Ignavibacteria bacterium]|nr:50S ribosomal protein L10 [Ignavibacteria bacterium]
MRLSEKEKIVSEVAETARRARGMFFTDFRGLTVQQANELRREFRKSDIDYRVVKNTLIHKALESVTGCDRVIDKLIGPTGIAFAFEDPVSPARIIQKFVDKHKKLSLKVCVLEHEVYEGSKLKELAKFPTREETIAVIMSTIQAPLAGVPNVINAIMRDLVCVISEIEKKKTA